MRKITRQINNPDPAKRLYGFIGKLPTEQELNRERNLSVFWYAVAAFLVFMFAIIATSCQGQARWTQAKADSVVYCKLIVWQSTEGGFKYTIEKTTTTASNNFTYQMIKGIPCIDELEPLNKLGAEGWDLVTSYNTPGQYPEVDYIFEKIYIRK